MDPQRGRRQARCRSSAVAARRSPEREQRVEGQARRFGRRSHEYRCGWFGKRAAAGHRRREVGSGRSASPTAVQPDVVGAHGRINKRQRRAAGPPAHRAAHQERLWRSGSGERGSDGLGDPAALRRWRRGCRPSRPAPAAADLRRGGVGSRADGDAALEASLVSNRRLRRWAACARASWCASWRLIDRSLRGGRALTAAGVPRTLQLAGHARLSVNAKAARSAAEHLSYAKARAASAADRRDRSRSTGRHGRGRRARAEQPARRAAGSLVSFMQSPVPGVTAGRREAHEDASRRRCSSRSRGGGRSAPRANRPSSAVFCASASISSA